jgi:hypothetical protein
MNASEIASYLLSFCKSLASFESFMFGSTLNGIGHDIDILIVGPSGQALSDLKEEMRLAGENLPLHVLYMQPSEVRHTGFVASENCVSLAHLASPAARARAGLDGAGGRPGGRPASR